MQVSGVSDNLDTAYQIIFENGRFLPEVSLQKEALPEGLALEVTDGIRLELQAGVVLEHPVYLRHIQTAGVEAPQTLTHQIRLNEGSAMLLIEEYASSTDAAYQNTIHLKLDAELDSRLTHYKTQNESGQAGHDSTLEVTQGENSVLSRCYIGLGGSVSQDRVTAHLEARNAACDFSAFYHGANNQKHEQWVNVRHLASNTSSHQLYRGIADDRSEILFDGIVMVKADVQSIVSHQKNQHLLLSGKAKSRARPQLEIYADDVECTHGATVGQLDENMLFYLRSRGISEARARSLLLEAFVSEVVDRIQYPSVKNYINAILSKGGVVA